MTTLQTHFHNAHVLVVDDDPVSREIVSSLLAEVGVIAHTAEHGHHALDILSEAGPDAFDLVLLDIQMPFMDGFAVTRELRTQVEFALLPVIAITAQTMEHEKNPGAKVGVNEQIGKPLDVTTFYRMLTKWIPASKQSTGGDLPIMCVAVGPAAISRFS
jgi:two-component system sensor histidine kinase/response regulator